MAPAEDSQVCLSQPRPRGQVSPILKQAADRSQKHCFQWNLSLKINQDYSRTQGTKSIQLGSGHIFTRKHSAALGTGEDPGATTVDTYRLHQGSSRPGSSSLPRARVTVDTTYFALVANGQGILAGSKIKKTACDSIDAT